MSDTTLRPTYSRLSRFLRILLIAFILILLALYIGMPSVMAIAAVVPDSGSAGEPPDEFTDVTLQTEDGLHLAAWYAEPTNGTAIILVHGAGSGRDSVRAYATMLHENGFGVLALNMRGYGDSEGHINRLGWRGTVDIGAAVDFLSGRGEVSIIGGMGISMGGEILLGAASTYPAIRAIVTDGATFRAVNEYRSLPMNEPFYRWFTQGVYSVVVRILSGDSLPDPVLLDSIRAAETTSFLFIAAGQSENELAFDEMYAEAVGSRGALWMIPDIAHTGGYAADPAGYEQRVIGFFSENLLLH